MEVIKQISKRTDFINWVMPKFNVMTMWGSYNLKHYWDAMPDTAKLALIQEWLRDEKSLHLQPVQDCDFDGRLDVTYWVSNYYFIISKIDGNKTWSTDDVYNSHNEALSKGIEEALKLIE